VLDLDETLVHSKFSRSKTADYFIPVDVEDRIATIYVEKRPYVDYFLEEMSKHYEVIIFTASLSMYADPLMDQMDPCGFCVARLYR